MAEEARHVSVTDARFKTPKGGGHDYAGQRSNDKSSPAVATKPPQASPLMGDGGVIRETNSASDIVRPGEVRGNGGSGASTKPLLAATASPVGEGKVDAPSISWRSMDSAPQDGKPIVVSDGKGGEHNAVWRRTRHMVKTAGGGNWQQTGYWAVHNAGGQQLTFKPQGWRPYV